MLPTTDFLLLQLKLKGIWQRRSLGQHFLTDGDILQRIADCAGASRASLVVEIGPGPGTLTTLLAEQAGGVLAVEFDERLRELHQAAFGTFPSIRFHYQDALRADLHGLARGLAEEWGLTELILAGNLPFQITSPLLFGQCGPDAPWHRIAVMVQKEVADRIVSPPGRKAYGILSVKLAYWWKVTERFDVPASAFFPRPQVDAAVLVLDRLPAADWPSLDEWPSLSEFIDLAFGQRRKMLINVLTRTPRHNYPRDRVEAAFDALKLDAQIRAEALDPATLRALSNHLNSKGE